MSRDQPSDNGSDLSELNDDQLHAEYAITQEKLAYHKEQVGNVTAQLHELTLKLAQKNKKETDMLHGTTEFDLNSHSNHKEASNMTDDRLDRMLGVNRLSIALEKLGVTDATSAPLIYRLLDDILDIASFYFDTELAQATKDKMTVTNNRSDAGILFTKKELDEYVQQFWNNIESLPITEENT